MSGPILNRLGCAGLWGAQCAAGRSFLFWKCLCRLSGLCWTMATVEDFLKAPSEELLDCFSREQLLRVADHFGLEISDMRVKESMKSIIKANLFDSGVVKKGEHAVQVTVPRVEVAGALGSSDLVLTFEQRRE